MKWIDSLIGTIIYEPPAQPLHEGSSISWTVLKSALASIIFRFHTTFDR